MIWQRSREGYALLAWKTARAVPVVAHNSDMFVFLLRVMLGMMMTLAFVAQVQGVILTVLVEGPPEEPLHFGVHALIHRLLHL